MSTGDHVVVGSPGEENATGTVCGGGGRTEAGRELGGAFSMSDGGDGLSIACDLVAVRGVAADLASETRVFVLAGVGDCPGGG